MGASYAVGVVRGGRLLLAPLDQVMQLRPSLAHLDRGSSDRALTGSEAVAADERVSGAGPALDAMDEDDANGTEMEPVRVCFFHEDLTACARSIGVAMCVMGSQDQHAAAMSLSRCDGFAHAPTEQPLRSMAYLSGFHPKSCRW